MKRIFALVTTVLLASVPTVAGADYWDVIGMQGTGSHRVVVEDLFLPEERLLRISDLQFQHFFPQPGRALFRNPLFLASWMNLLYCEMIAVAVGTARGALDLYEQDLREKTLPLPPFARRYEPPIFSISSAMLKG